MRALVEGLPFLLKSVFSLVGKIIMTLLETDCEGLFSSLVFTIAQHDMCTPILTTDVAGVVVRS